MQKVKYFCVPKIFVRYCSFAHKMLDCLTFYPSNTSGCSPCLFLADWCLNFSNNCPHAQYHPTQNLRLSNWTFWWCLLHKILTDKYRKWNYLILLPSFLSNQMYSLFKFSRLLRILLNMETGNFWSSQATFFNKKELEIILIGYYLICSSVLSEWGIGPVLCIIRVSCL